MELATCVFIASLIVLFILAIICTTRGYKIKELKNENKRLYDELGSKRNEINNLKGDLRIEREKSIQLERNSQQIVKALDVSPEEVRQALNTIKKSYKVSNKNKITLIKMLIKLNLFNYSQISLDKLKSNQESVITNVKVLLDYMDGNMNIQDDGSLENLANTIFTLILYKQK